jgi:phosphatidylserine/phosphatidylglycerophosphate/cardiolipin synthase-like enzyme
LVTSDLDSSRTANRRAIAALLKGEDGDLIRERLRVLKVSRSGLLNGLIHAKCIVVDGKRGYLGSANFSTSGLERNLELGVALSTEEAAALDGLITHLEAHGDLDDCTSNILVNVGAPRSE